MGDRYQSVSVRNELFSEVEKLAAKTRKPARQFIEECVEEIIALHGSTQGQRRLPFLVSVLDAAKKHEENPEMIVEPAVRPSSNSNPLTLTILNSSLKKAEQKLPQSKKPKP